MKPITLTVSRKIWQILIANTTNTIDPMGCTESKARLQKVQKVKNDVVSAKAYFVEISNDISKMKVELVEHESQYNLIVTTLQTYKLKCVEIRNIIDKWDGVLHTMNVDFLNQIKELKNEITSLDADLLSLKKKTANALKLVNDCKQNLVELERKQAIWWNFIVLSEHYLFLCSHSSSTNKVVPM